MESRISSGTVKRWHCEVGCSAGCGAISAESVASIVDRQTQNQGTWGFGYVVERSAGLPRNEKNDGCKVLNIICC